MEKGILRTVKGDATVPQFTTTDEIAIIPHCCNNENGWGAGFVMALSAKWKKPERVYRQLCTRYSKDKLLGKVCYAKIDNHFIVANMVAQNGTISENNSKPVKYKALISCMEKVTDYIEMIKDQVSSPVVIHAPKFCSDLAGGNFDFVLELINEIWLSEGIDVVIYEFEPDHYNWGVIA